MRDAAYAISLEFPNKTFTTQTRRTLGRAHLPPTKVIRRLS